MPRVINKKLHKDCPFSEKELMGFYDIVAKTIKSIKDYLE